MPFGLFQERHGGGGGISLTFLLSTRPNPGNAGWGAIIRQNGKFAWTFGHCSRATNNAMELLAGGFEGDSIEQRSNQETKGHL
jgi:hypothetical protein